MTIDEAIQFCHQKSENIKLKAEPQVFIDIAKMLEELQSYKQGNCTNDCEHFDNGVKYGYNMAIDDFLKRIHEKYTEEERKQNFKQYCCSIKQELADIGQKLKAGGEDAKL